MNIYAASDLHGNLPDVPGDADLILLGGDICPDFRAYGRRPGEIVDRGGTQQSAWLIEELGPWLDAISCPVVSIWGNHDFVGEKPFLVPQALSWTLLRDTKCSLMFPKRVEPARYFSDDYILPQAELEIMQLSIYGTPWVPGLPYWAFFARPDALQARADAIPDGIDVLITHGPPYRVGDYIPTSEKQRNKYGNYGGAHVGDPTLNGAIERVRPKAVICGHIHEARGSYYLDGIPVYNVAAVDSLYDLYPDPWTKIDLKND